MMMTGERANASRPWYARLHVQIFAAMGAGVVLGAVLGETVLPWVGWMGTLFIRLLRMVVVPLIFTSIVTGVASVGSARSLGRLGAKTLAYYLITSLLAILTGLVLVNMIQPGDYADIGRAQRVELPELETPESLAEIFLRLVPVNPIEAMATGDVLGIIFFGVLVGIVLIGLPERQRSPLAELFGAGFELMMVLTGGIIRLAPLGVLGLITQAVVTSGFETFRALGVYMVTVAGGLTIHLFLTLPLLLLLAGIRPWVHFRNMAEAMATAFSTSSSSATLPLTMRCVEKKVGVSNRVTSFVLPMGATINMDGTALYECVGVLFIAQVLDFGLSAQAQAVVVVTALLASIGAAGIPSAGLVMIFIVTEAVNLRGPEVAMLIGTLLAIDRPLDMYRTMINVFSDSCGAAIIARSEGEAQVDTG
ncbi:MAG: dicarboxylate/amino acid:cation symporter [Acidobacteriota bacterium]